MRRSGLVVLALGLGTPNALSQTVVASNGQSRAQVIIARDISLPEEHAANELALFLSRMTGAPIKVDNEAEKLPVNTILVGRGPLAEKLFPDVDWAHLDPEEIVYRTKNGITLVAGGRPRGTVYATYHLLEKLGCRWWTPWASTIPNRRNLTLPKLNANEKPAFESRDAFWYPAFDGDWAARNGTNGQTARLEAKHGGKVLYAGGFVHTFYPLVPPEKYFQSHPEWYSLIDGKRTADNAQLCTTDPNLRDFIVERVKQWLRENPNASIVSVSQNDCFRPCQCERCQAIVKEQGSESGPMIALANYVAEHIEKDFPNVAVDTLAYQYTRKAPATLRPRPNVIVRLCSIECNFAQPLSHPSNASFANDIRDWSRLTNRLYIWNYNTNFAHYPQPIPNSYVLGPNARFFRNNGVRGVFEQGAYQSNGGEMAEMRAWVQAQLLWNPFQDDKALIDEFLNGYYGAAGKSIGRYLDLMADAAKDQNATIYDSPSAAFLDFPTMSKAERLWQDAEGAVAKDPDLLWRVRQGHLAVRYVWLNRWRAFRAEAQRENVKWPLPTSRRAVADDWLAAATGKGPAGWTPMTHVNEGGLTPAQFVARFAADPVEPPPLPGRKAGVPLPADLDAKGHDVIDLQDDLARLANEPEWATLMADPAASDGIACRMPGSHHEWAFQIPVSAAGKSFRPGRYRVVLVARLEGAPANGPAVSFGVYDEVAKKDLGSQTFAADKLGTNYRSLELGTLDLTATSTIWVAPPARSDLKAVWIDRVILVEE